jgi:hypothetical protein
MVKDNIKITAVDPGVMEDYPKIDLNIDLPPSQPTTKPNNESVPAFEPTDAGINEVPTLVDKTVQEPTPATPIVQATKELPCQSSRTQTKVKSYEPSMKGKTYNYSNTQLEKSMFEYDPRVVIMIFTQLSLKAAIKAWGKDATNAAEAEMKQLHWRNSFMPKLWTIYLPSKRRKF